MKTLILVTMLMSMCVQANTVKQEIKTLLSSIRDEVNSSQDQRSLLNAKNQLERVLDVLAGGSNGGPQNGSRVKLSCLARDNDGRDPWVLGVKDPRTLKDTRLPSSMLGSLSSCQMAKDNFIGVDSSVIVCIARDNDGRAPFSIGYYKDNKLVKKLSSLGSLENCVKSMKNSYHSRFAASFCVSRDNDGRSPYVEMVVEFATGNISRNSTYNTLEACIAGSKKK